MCCCLNFLGIEVFADTVRHLNFSPQIYTREIGRMIQSKDLVGITTTTDTALKECFEMDSVTEEASISSQMVV